MNIKYIRLQALALFFSLTMLGVGLQWFFYSDHLRELNEKIEDVFEAEHLRINEVLLDQIELLSFVRKRLEQDEDFDRVNFRELVSDVENSFRDIYAFNFANSEYIIEYVYPEERNKAALGKNLSHHPDPIVFNLFKQGISQKRITFLPPIMTYQGEKAVIFYCPVHFKSGKSGFLNLVVAANDLFSAYRLNNTLSINSFSVFDKDSERNYFNSISGEVKKSDLQLYTGQFLGREVEYSFNIGNTLEAQRIRFLQQVLIIIIIVSLLTYFFYHSLKSQAKISKKYIDIKNDSNLLKTLIHDISTPILSLKVGLQKLARENSENKELFQGLLGKVNNSIDIIMTIRDVLKDQKDQYPVTEVYLKEIVDTLVEGYKENIEQGRHTFTVDIDESVLIKCHTEKNILKNQILGNLIHNAFKHSVEDSEIKITFKENVLVISNPSLPLNKKKLKVLNSETEIDRSRIKGEAFSLGYGLFIAKIFCRHAGIEFKITQNQKTQLVETSLFF
ncbi:MAG: hypothetical protein CME65_02420 [Halobacteriovoraceae bacterium]|nr:hypothetical protein [Halobacteriovoraceae bacterium]|tara:strand:+ start:2966 stop:4477 length:1512 start_codon:yes stop_codon:yes gene_type:complete